MRTRIFSVELEHTKYGPNWDRKQVTARTAAEAIRKAESGEPKSIRAVNVSLLAESE